MGWRMKKNINLLSCQQLAVPNSVQLIVSRNGIERDTQAVCTTQKTQSSPSSSDNTYHVRIAFDIHGYSSLFLETRASLNHCNRVAMLLHVLGSCLIPRSYRVSSSETTINNATDTPAGRKKNDGG